MNTPDQPATLVIAAVGGMLFGLASVPHCFGMCGPLHMAMCVAGKKRSFKSLTLFNVGRILGYTLIGVVLGFAGDSFVGVFYKPMDLQKAYGEKKVEETPKPCCQTPKAAVPKSCCEAAKQADQAATNQNAVPKSCCEAAKQAERGTPKKEVVPKSCCEAAKQAEKAALQKDAVPKSCCEAATVTGSSRPKLMLGSTARRLLMFIFPAVILLLVGIRGLLKRPAAVGAGSDGWLTRLFKKFQASGPVACGVGASFIPCGMLYVAFAFAVSTMSAFLGGVFMFFYCLTITFFMQLGIMVGTRFGKTLGGKVDKIFPWLAFAGAAVYICLFFYKGD